MRHVLAIAAPLLLAACAQPLPDSQAPPLAMTPTCRPRVQNIVAGISGDARQILAMKNDGGWCAIAVTVATPGERLPHGEPVLLEVPPTNGEVAIAHLVSRTRVAYRPRPGFTGSDGFMVRSVATRLTWRFDVEVLP